MSLEFYYYKVKKANKQHDCEMCGQKIEVGEKYSYSSGKYEGDFFERKLHQKCEDVLNEALRDTGENEYDYDMILDWWQENKCSICKFAYPICDINDNCPEYIHSACKDHKNGKCTLDGINCDKMDRSCWCTLFEADEPVTGVIESKLKIINKLEGKSNEK